ncbi:TetR/AcrR family transcriptional regulator [Microbacterium hydrocarbonoxydans]|uniref:DNA-binding transcriptional regulator, AcrR family n=1 Tax=Microbacterium hydrocarbonoxydans TaxID=273678 RepID=A0A1H4J218_9MICO|nr:TetR/AcrR family transcriptional regulator [Microbacterium hydrocarbonoxydans]SEB40283.1 DNA-binding transcriptional regulator, AcrR family [Microbacterium hydrocarbonoxydans]
MKTTTPTSAPTTAPKRPSAARARLIDTATRLFYEEGIHAVGVDRIIDEAAVTRATLYNQFGGKENLVLAYLRNEDEMLRAMFAEAGEAVTDPDQLVDAVIEGIAADIRLRHTRGCPFINAAAEYPDADGAVRRLIDEHREWFRSTLQAVAEQAGLESAADVAASLVLLRDAALVGGYLDGDERVTPAFERTARSVVAAHRPL